VIREGRPEEARALRDLAEQSFRESFSKEMPAEVLDHLMLRRFTEARFLAEIEDPELGFFVGESSRQLAGYAVVRPSAAVIPGSDPAWELNRIYVLKEHQGTGLGDGLMKTALGFARARGARSCWLKVLETNARAMAFYHRWGFEARGREDMDLQGTLLPHLLLVRSWEDA
jgi:ribosomal protein S18 acetylase RimI-like enzyme